MAHHAPILSHLFSNILLFLEISANSLSLSLFLSFALKNLSFSLQLSQPIVEEPKKEREMASFSEAPPGDPKVGEKIFKTKCAQCHTVDKGAGHKQGIHFFFSSDLFIYLFLYIFDLVAACLDLSDKLKFKVCVFSSCILDFCCVVLICWDLFGLNELFFVYHEDVVEMKFA